MRTPSGIALQKAILPGPHRKMKQAELARTLGVSGPSVWGWVHLKARPEPEHREALEKLFPEVTVDGWFTAEERAIAHKNFAAVKPTGT